MSFNIRPRHLNGQDFGNSRDASILYEMYDTPTKSHFETNTTFGTDRSAGTLVESGYQYTIAEVIVETKSFVELAPVGDYFTKIITKHFEELAPILDQFYNGKKVTADLNPIQEEFTKTIIKHFSEGMAVLDQLDINAMVTQNMPVDCEFTKTIIKHFSEKIPMMDSIVGGSVGFVAIDDIYTTNINTNALFDEVYTTTIETSGLIDDYFSTVINTSPYNLAAVTNVTSPDNEFQPTIILDGAIVISNSATEPSEGSNPTNYIKINNAGVAGLTYCDMFDAVFTLDYTGGTWTVKSPDPLGDNGSPSGNLGKQVPIFGLTATIVDFGANRSSSAFEYETGGIFSPPIMHKSFSIVTYANRPYLQFIGNTQLFAIPQSNTYTTLKGMAQAIGVATGVNIAWLVPDAPYRDTFGQSGLTALEALGSLAGQMGATLRWNGNSGYVVAYPDYPGVVFNIVSENLVTAYSYKHHLNLDFGVTGTGVIGIPINQYFDPSSRTLPGDPAGAEAAGNPGEIEIVENIRTPIKSNQPSTIRDLPNDTEKVFIQIRVPTDGTDLSSPYLTNDPNHWELLANFADGPDSSPYIDIQTVGETTRKRLIIDYTLFPVEGNDDVANSNFELSLAIQRASLQPQYQAGQDDAQSRLRDLIARIQANIRFLKTFTATVSFVFFGALPMPGMLMNFTRCGENVQGIIESVSLNNGIVTCEIAAYLRINLLDQKLQWELTSGGA